MPEAATWAMMRAVDSMQPEHLTLRRLTLACGLWLSVLAGTWGLACRVVHAEASDAGVEVAHDAAAADDDHRALAPAHSSHDAGLTSEHEPSDGPKTKKPLKPGTLTGQDAVASQRETEDAEREEAARREAEVEVQRIEEARRAALHEADLSKTEAQRILAEQRAALEGVRRELSELKERLRVEREAERVQAASQATAIAEMRARVESVEAGSPAADALYEALLRYTDSLAASIEKQMNAYRALAPVPRYLGKPAALAAPTEQLVQARTLLIEMARGAEQQADALNEEQSDLAFSRLDRMVKGEQELSAQRIEMLARVSPERRAELLGLGREGFSQLKLAVAHLQLSLQWAFLAKERTIKHWISRAHDPFLVGDALLRLLAVLGVLWVYRSLRKLQPKVRRGADEWLVQLTRSASVARTIKRTITLIDVVYPELLFLGAIVLIGGVILEPYSNVLSVFYTVALYFAWYRLAVVLCHRSLAWGTASGVSGVDQVRASRALRTVRLVGRTGLALTLILLGAVAVLGKGSLYYLLLRLVFAICVVVAYAVIRMWHDDIVDAYLRYRPSGFLSSLVRYTRGRFYGFVVAFLALAVLVASALLSAAHSFVLEFDHSRRALAYLFRRRLERQAGGAAEEVPVNAPFDARAESCFTRDPVSDPALLCARFPGMPQLETALEEHKGDARVGAFLLVGREGFGKTTWLRQAEHKAKALGLDPTLVSLTQREITARGVVTTLAHALKLQETLSVDALATQLSEGPRRMVIIDDAHFWFLRTEGGAQAFAALSTLIERSGKRVFWLVSCGHHAYEFLSWIWRSSDVFRHVVQLSRWSEEEITELLGVRTRAARLGILYDDLLVDRLEGVDSSSQLLSTARDYNRLIWDYAEGSPRAALLAWRESLLPAPGRRARVHLFASPSLRPLEQLEGDEKFVLASVLWHGAIVAEHAAESLRLPLALVHSTLSRLRESGVLVQRGAQFEISAHFWPAATRHLVRNHLIGA